MAILSRSEAQRREGMMAGCDDLVALSAVELRRLIGAGEVSPVELLEACIAR